MLRELNLVEQAYRPVLYVLDGMPVTEIAERFGVGRQSVRRRHRLGGRHGRARLCGSVLERAFLPGFT
jgi:transposase